MTDTSSHEVSRLIEAVVQGDKKAMDQLYDRVYDELRRRAHFQRDGWHGDQTMNTTALVHEAYLKLAGQSSPGWKGRAHFLSAAAKAMRHILIDYAKKRRTIKHGGGVQKLSLEEMKAKLDESLEMTPERAEALVELDEALERLKQFSERQSHVVECRLFANMSVEETAAVLDVSEATVKRDYAMAKAWLYGEMRRAREA